MTKRYYIYDGDINAEHGGVFYDPREWNRYGYASAVRITPCSYAGGPDNCFWVEELTVLKKDPAMMEQAMKACGIEPTEAAKMTPAQQRNNEILSCLHYGYYDMCSSEMVQIGKKQDAYRGHDPCNPDVVLRGNASIRNYAYSKCE